LAQATNQWRPTGQPTGTNRSTDRSQRESQPGTADKPTGNNRPNTFFVNTTITTVITNIDIVIFAAIRIVLTTYIRTTIIRIASFLVH